MKTSCSALLLTLGLAGAAGCKSTTDPTPKQFGDADVLMRAHGYWEWESSVGLNSRLTPAVVGFSRQLTFQQDSLVHIYHNRQPFGQPPFHLSYGVLNRCGTAQILFPLVRYKAESQVPNTDLRTYSIRLATDTTLLIAGETACVDGGLYETYRWHRK